MPQLEKLDNIFSNCTKLIVFPDIGKNNSFNKVSSIEIEDNNSSHSFVYSNSLISSSEKNNSNYSNSSNINGKNNFEWKDNYFYADFNNNEINNLSYYEDFYK